MLFTQKISYIVQHNLLYVNFLRGGLNFLCNTAPPLSFSPASLLLQFSSGRFELPLQYRPCFHFTDALFFSFSLIVSDCLCDT